LPYSLRLAAGPCDNLDLVPGEKPEPATPVANPSLPFEVYTFALDVEGVLPDLLEQPTAVVIDVQRGDVLEPFACGDVPAASTTGEYVAGLIGFESGTLVGMAILTEPDPNRVAVTAYLLLDSPGDQGAMPGTTPTAEPGNEPDDGEPEGGV
jgi:hypothetical protein